MKLGVVFPQTEIGNDVKLIRNFAVGVEGAGFDFLAAYDHVIGHRPDDAAQWQRIGPYTDSHAFHEVFVLLSFLAGITSTLELVTEVLVLPQRQTVLVAKQAAELQLLSNGRLRIGVGVGWNSEEYRALGMNFHDRGKRVVDQIELIRRLWKDDLVSEEGAYHHLRSMALNPRPMQRPIPIWIGGSAPVVIKRAAAVADGFVLDQSIRDAPALLGKLHGYLREFHRDAEAFGFAARVQLSQGGFDDSVAEAMAWRALGVTHLSVNTMNARLPSPHLHLDLATGFLTAWRKTYS